MMYDVDSSAYVLLAIKVDELCELVDKSADVSDIDLPQLIVGHMSHQIRNG